MARVGNSTGQGQFPAYGTVNVGEDVTQGLPLYYSQNASQWMITDSKALPVMAFALEDASEDDECPVGFVGPIISVKAAAVSIAAGDDVVATTSGLYTNSLTDGDWAHGFALDATGGTSGERFRLLVLPYCSDDFTGIDND